MLSPLNFAALIARGGIDRADRYESVQHKREAISVQAWECPSCFELHRDESSAEECCATDEEVNQEDALCPCCGATFAAPNEFRQAADCCLWKDLDATTRWRMADAVEAGSTWREQLQISKNH